MITTAEEFSDVFRNEYFQFVRKLLITVGVWPYATRQKRYLFRFIIITGLLNGIPFMIREFLNRWRGNRKAAIHSIPPLLTQFVCLIKLLNFVVNEAQIRLLLCRVHGNWKCPMGEEERKILITYGEYSKATSRLYAGCLYIAMVFFLLVPLAPRFLDIIKPLNVSRPSRLVFPADYGVPIDDYYIFMMLHAYLGTLAAITIIVASDVFFINVVYHACYLFAIAKYNLKHVDDNITDYTASNLRVSKFNHTFNNQSTTEVCIRRIGHSVSCHDKAISFATLVENTFTWSLFIILGINLIIISLTGFQVLTQKDSWDDVLTCFTYIFGQVCHLYLLSLPGQLLINESESIRDSVTNSYNVDVPAAAQKMLIPILIRSLRTSRVTAGKFFVLGMETFMSILQTSISYFTVLSNFC